MRGNLRFAWIAIAAIVAMAASLEAENWVFNGGFTHDLRGWDQERYMVWSPVDAGSAPTSGSLLVVNTFTMNAQGIEQCLEGPAIVAGASYTYGGMFRIPSGQATTGWAAVGLRWHAQPECGGDPIGEQPRAESSVTGDAFHSLESTDVAPAGAVSARFVAYATKSSASGAFIAYLDDLFFGPALTAAAGPPVIYVSNAAHIVGYGGAKWRTDLEVHNPTGDSVSYTVELLKRDQGNPTPAAISDVLPAGASKRYPDVVYASFGLQGAAALRVTPAAGWLAVSSRTYNDAASGTYGQYIPGQPDHATILFGEEARLVQLTHDVSTVTGYRTNLGFLSTVGIPITIEVELHLGAGTMLATLTYDLQPYEYRQIDKIFESANAGAVSDGYAVVRTTTPGGRFLTYAAVIDNATADPICVQPAAY